MKKKSLLGFLFCLIILGSIPNGKSLCSEVTHSGEILPNGEIPDFMGWGIDSNEKYTIEWTCNSTGVVALLFSTMDFNIWMFGDHDDFSLAKNTDISGQFEFTTEEAEYDYTLIFYNRNPSYVWIFFSITCEDSYTTNGDDETTNGESNDNPIVSGYNSIIILFGITFGTILLLIKKKGKKYFLISLRMYC